VRKALGLFIGALVLVNCSPENETWNPPNIPNHLLAYPLDTLPSKAEVSLGRDLFFDSLLSGNQGISCSSCHLPEFAFTDGQPVSVGVSGALGFRNAPSLFNLVYKPLYFAEGGVFPLERTINPPLETDFEMNHNMGLLISDLRENDYASRFFELYGDSVEPYQVVAALSAYMRTLLSINSQYDQFLEGQFSFSIEQERGLSLFKQIGCAQCHTLPMTTDYSFAWNGYNSEGEDRGRFRLTLLPADDHRFMIPSLRNVAITAPYFHDGGVATLSRVMDHYRDVDTLWKKGEPVFIQSFTKEEGDKIISFLNTLTEVSTVDKK